MHEPHPDHQFITATAQLTPTACACVADPKISPAAAAGNLQSIEAHPSPPRPPRRHPHAPTTMVLKIRLARFGRTNAPFYNIVVAHARYLSPSPSPHQARKLTAPPSTEQRATRAPSKSSGPTTPSPSATRTTRRARRRTRTSSWTFRGRSTGSAWGRSRATRRGGC